MKYLLITLVFASMLKADDPKAPVWPDVFTQSFVEDLSYPVIGTGTTKGTIYYDWTNKRYRVDRENGKWDRYCGTIFKFRDLACSHIVVDGMRYLYFPEKNYCCMCCTAQHGCGLLKPNWLEGAEYEGEVQSEENGRVLEVFNKKGLQDNLAYFDKETGTMARITQQPNDDQKYDVSSFQKTVDSKKLELPAECDPSKKCGTFTICSAIGTLKSNMV